MREMMSTPRVDARGVERGPDPGPRQGQAAATRVTFPNGAIIRAILKDVPPEALGSGATLFHDHLSLSSPRPYAKPSATPAPPQWLENVDAVVEEVKAAAKDGVSCIVTGGTRDLG
jgi:hypothetical protein